MGCGSLGGRFQESASLIQQVVQVVEMASEGQEGRTHSISHMEPAEVLGNGSQFGMSWVGASEGVTSGLYEKFGFLFVG